MQTNLRGRDLIGDLDFSKEEVETVLDVAWDLKRKRALNEPHAYLRDKTLAMLFFFSSTRTRGPAKRVEEMGFPSTPILSFKVARSPNPATLSLMVTRPSAIHVSNSRREPKPARANNFCNFSVATVVVATAGFFLSLVCLCGFFSAAGLALLDVRDAGFALSVPRVDLPLCSDISAAPV